MLGHCLRRLANIIPIKTLYGLITIFNHEHIFSGADPGYVERGDVAGGLGDLPQDFWGNLVAPNAFSRILVIYSRLSLC